MKYLYIKNNQGFYSLNGIEEEGKTIDSITKEDLMILLEKVVESSTDDFDMDEYNDEKIKNPAHQIIYKNVYEKFISLKQKKDQFMDETSNLYKEAISKYKIEIEEQ